MAFLLRLMTENLLIYGRKKKTHTKYVLYFFFIYVMLFIVFLFSESVVVYLNKLRWEGHSDNDGYWHFKEFLTLKAHLFMSLALLCILIITDNTINTIVINWNSQKIMLNCTKLFIPEYEINIEFKSLNYKLEEIELDKETHSKEYKLILYKDSKNIFSFKNTAVGMSLLEFKSEVLSPLIIIVENKEKWSSNNFKTYSIENR